MKNMVNITPAPVSVPAEVVAKIEAEREAHRASHGVSLVSGADEGEILKHLRGGLYGFTYAPQTLECGLFEKGPYLSFEMHKLADNRIILFALVTPEVKAKIAGAADTVEVEFFPQPYNTAVELVLLPYENLSHLKPPDRDHGNRIKGFYQPA